MTAKQHLLKNANVRFADDTSIDLKTIRDTIPKLAPYDNATSKNNLINWDGVNILAKNSQKY